MKAPPPLQLSIPPSSAADGASVRSSDPLLCEHGRLSLAAKNHAKRVRPVSGADALGASSSRPVPTTAAMVSAVGSRAQIVLNDIFAGSWELYRPPWTTDDVCRDCVVTSFTGMQLVTPAPVPVPASPDRRRPPATASRAASQNATRLHTIGKTLCARRGCSIRAEARTTGRPATTPAVRTAMTPLKVAL